ncbi:MAG: nucleotide exchange factor GrpE [Burkholderiaceae bacterium]
MTQDSNQSHPNEDTQASQEAPATEQAGQEPAAQNTAPEGAEGQGSDLAAQLAERDDQLIRLAAEIDNLRKRHATELGNASKFAIESFAEALLPVADSLTMALSVPDQSLEGLKNGVELTLKQLQQAFDKGRLVAIDPVGEKFDPNRHQAISMVDGKASNPPVASGHVVQVMQKGYLIGERVLRPALVAVAS